MKARQFRRQQRQRSAGRIAQHGRWRWTMKWLTLAALLFVMAAWGISTRWDVRYHFGNRVPVDLGDHGLATECIDGFAVRVTGGVFWVFGAGIVHRWDSSVESWVTPLLRPEYGFQHRAIMRGRTYCVDAYGRPEGFEPAVEWELRLPLWMPSAVLGALAAGLWWLDRSRVAPGHCRCGYDLTGNVSGRCPECGTAIRRGRSCDTEQPRLMCTNE